MTLTTPDSIAFIGGGNMARALIGGLLRAGAAAQSIVVAEPGAAQREALARELRVTVTADNAEAAAAAHTWVFATKPQVLREVCASLAAVAAARRPLLVSIAAGITTAQIDRWLGGGHAVVRAMPNTPALLGAGVTGLFANAAVNAAARAQAERLLAAAGATVWLEDEARMDAVTATSGSGPAYLFLLAQAMQAAAESEGLSPEQARTLVVETLAGAARMLKEDGADAATLKQRVTSPNGTTQAALDAFAEGGFTALVGRAVHAARIRGAELSAMND